MKIKDIIIYIVLLAILALAAFYYYLNVLRMAGPAWQNQPPQSQTQTSAAMTQPAAPITITLSDNNTMIPLKVGDSFLLKLGENYDWNVTIGNQAALSREANVAVGRGAQGIYRADSAGQAMLAATGAPACRAAVPACASPSINFTLTINVSAGASAPASGVATGQGNLKTYTGQQYGIAIQYPPELDLVAGNGSLSHDWQYLSNFNGTKILEIDIPKSFEPGTNFGDSRLTVGVSADRQALADCLKPLPGPTAPATAQKTINGQKFTAVKGGDAGAGNYYDISSYRIVKNNQCFSIDEIIHYTNRQNYPPELGIKEFDRAKITDELELMTDSFKFTN